MQSGNQDSFGMSGLRKMFQKRRNKILLYIALALFLPPVFAALYIFLPEVYIELVGFFLPDEQYRVSVRIGRTRFQKPGAASIFFVCTPAVVPQTVLQGRHPRVFFEQYKKMRGILKAQINGNLTNAQRSSLQHLFRIR